MGGYEPSSGFGSYVNVPSVTATAADIASEQAWKRLAGTVLQVRRANAWYKVVRDLFDAKTRDGGYLKLGVQLTIEVGSKLFDAPLSLHPFFTFHKAHIQALAEVLNVIHARKDAAAAFNRAVAAADSSADVKSQFRALRARVSGLGFQYVAIVEILRLREEQKKGVMTDAAVRDMRQDGLSWDDLVQGDDLLAAYQAEWSGLLANAVQLLVMLEGEVRAAQEAMDAYNKVIQSLASGPNLSRVASLATENDRQWAAYDRAVHPSAGKSELAVTDPVRYAKIQRDSVSDLVDAISDMVDFVHGPDVTDRTLAGVKGAKLAHVLSVYS